MNNLDNIVVLGGGTAGWLTAITVKEIWPKSIITLIEGPDGSPTAAAGESAPSILFRLLEKLNIDVFDLMKNADATFKSGSVFTNWRGTGESYYSPNLNCLHPTLKAENYFTDDLNIHTSSTHFWNWIISQNIDMSSFGPGKLMKEHLAPVIPLPNGELVPISDYSMHFNAIKTTKYLRNIGLRRGINRIIDDVVYIEKNNDIIKSLRLKSGNINNCDFIFDCSGFRRYIIGNTLNANWNDYSKYLTVDTAIPFFLPMGESIPPYTEAIAMKYGWMWKVPLKDRYGSGYNFDSRFCSVEEAQKELEIYLNQMIEFQKPIKYKAGCYATPWIGNCIAVGLAASFLEPLCSTNLSTVAMQLSRIIDDCVVMRSLDKNDISEFNKFFVDTHHKLMSFAYYHYMGGRKDTEFWKQFDAVIRAPEPIKMKLSNFSSRTPARNFYTSSYLDVEGPEVWMSVDAGIKTHLEPYIESAKLFGNEHLLSKVLESLVSTTSKILKDAVSHRECLNIIDKRVWRN